MRMNPARPLLMLMEQAPVPQNSAPVGSFFSIPREYPK